MKSKINIIIEINFGGVFMGDRVADMLEFIIMLVLLVAFISFGMFTLATTNKFSRFTQQQLAQEVVDFENKKYDDYNGKVVSGREVKNLIIEYGNRDAAFIVSTIWLNTAITKSIAINGTLADDFVNARRKVPGTRLTGATMQLNDGTEVNEPYALNFGSVLTSCTLYPANYDTDGTHKSPFVVNGSNVLSTSEIRDFGNGNNIGFQEKLKFENGVYRTAGTLATNTKDKNIDLRYDKTHDLDTVGTTCYVPDMAQFYSYLLKNLSGEIIGFVFIQISSNVTI